MLSYKKFFVIKMDEFEYDLTNTLTKELKQGGSIGSLVGKLVSKIGPLFIKHAPKILQCTSGVFFRIQRREIRWYTHDGAIIQR